MLVNFTSLDFSTFVISKPDMKNFKGMFNASSMYRWQQNTKDKHSNPFSISNHKPLHINNIIHDIFTGLILLNLAPGLTQPAKISGLQGSCCLILFLITALPRVFLKVFDLTPNTHELKPRVIYSTYNLFIALMTNLFGEGIMQMVSSRPATLKAFEKNVFKPKPAQEGEEGDSFSDQLMKWAISNEVEHVTFVCFPYNQTICSKQESLLDMEVKHISDKGVKMKGQLVLNKEYLLKNETDGSSFPSGGLRSTHEARAYCIRDPLSQIFIRKSNKLLYIPSLLVTHNGDALDDKTLFRKAEAIMKTNATRLLQKLGKNPKQILLNLGLEQEFFVIPKTAFNQRPDLRFCGRALVGQVGAKHQQFADHYFGKLPQQVQTILSELEQELLQIGIPFKAKHNEVANNQFQFCAIYSEAGKAIDQNLITMDLMKQVFERHGYTVLLHEKPFMEINGSGKHANWSLGYVDADGKVKNLFAVPKKEEDVKLFQLFILITLSALKNHNALYFASVAPPGNEIRLGGHEAPPRIISAYLGATVNAIVDGVAPPVRKNLKENLPFLPEDIFQEDTDRNRTSAFPYTGQKFEFRALGSSQNAAWPMAVISATLAKEMQVVEQKIDQGATIDQLIEQLREDTRPVRFDGNGYSHQWGVEAKKRGLYVNQSFSELYQRVDKDVYVFEEIGACNKQEIAAKCQVMRDLYQMTVETEAKALYNMANKKIIPRATRYLQELQSSIGSTNTFIKSYADNFAQTLGHSLQKLDELRVSMEKCGDVQEAGVLREKIVSIGEELGEICSLLSKDPSFPDLQDFLQL